MRLKLLTVIVTGLACLGIPESGLSQTTGVNLLIQTNGDVKIKREKWKNFQKATIGAFLSSNDRIQLGTKASATLLCSNTKKWQATPGKEFRVSEGCPRGIASRSRTIARAPSRATNEPIPYIISPRNTSILTNRPLLQWNAVSGATSYQVQLRGSGLEWQTETNNTQILYPGELALQPGVRYLLIVTTDKGVSSQQEVGAKLRFSVLDAAKAESIKTEVTQIKQEKLTPEAEKLALAYLYESNGLKAEAIELLQKLSQQKN